MERYRSINYAYYREALGAILTFDLTCIDSFNDLESWYKDLLNATIQTPFIILVGNKCDLTDQIEVSEDNIRDFCESHNGMPYFETSAKEGDGVKQMIDALINGLPQVTEVSTTMILDEPQPQTKCC